MINLLKKHLNIFLVLALAVVTSCSSTSKKNADGVDDAADATTLELNGTSDDNTAGPLQTVFFDFNSARLTDAAKATLEENAMWLKATDEVTIQVEGHTDERGGHQYNLALGERRAKVVLDYLVALGVSESRITMISYGKEKPVSFGHDEDSWGRNRRANFVISSK